MNHKLKYTFILGATLALSFCNGKQSSVYDPTNGANAGNAQQYLNTVPQTPYLPRESIRNQSYTFNIPTQAQLDQCLEAYEQNGTVNAYCNQAIYYVMYGTFGSNFASGNYVQDPIQISYGSDNRNIDLRWKDLFRNQSYVPQFNQYMGSNYPHFQPTINMQNFCGNPATYTNIQYSNPCSRMNWGYAQINLDNTMGLNYFRGGQFDKAETCFGPRGCSIQASPCVTPGGAGCGVRRAGTVLSRRNVGLENKAYQKELLASWQNLKKLPKNVAVRAGVRVTDVLGSIVERVISRFEANMAMKAAYNYADAGYSQDMVAYYDSAYDTACRTAQYTQLAALEPDSPCPPDKFHYVVGDAPAQNNEYQISTCE